MKLSAKLCIVLWLAAMATAHAQNCSNTAPAGTSDRLKLLFEAFVTAPARGDCGSLASVPDKIASRGKTGGRRLETDKPLNVAETEANLDKALRDPAIKARIDKVTQEIPDENQQLVYRAALMDEEGYYNARELLIQRLLQRVK